MQIMEELLKIEKNEIDTLSHVQPYQKTNKK
jgi:hypothetical protein